MRGQDRQAEAAARGRPRGAIAAALAGLALLAACETGTGAPAEIVAFEALLDLGDVDPAGGARADAIRLLNVGGTEATLLMGSVEMLDDTCGAFVLDPDDAWALLAPGDEVAVPVTFRPDPARAGGCDCHAYGIIRLEFDAEPGVIEVPAVVRGTCDRSLRCNPDALDFGTTFLDKPVRRTVTCRNLGDAAIDVTGLALRDGSSPVLALAGDLPYLPARLEPFEAFAFKVRHAPEAEGEDAGTVVVATTEGDVSVAVAGTAEPRFPACADGIPASPTPVLDHGNVTMTLETDPGPHDFEGTVRARWYYDEGIGTISDILIAQGCYADPGTWCGQEGHLAKCQQCSPERTFWNLHAVPHDDGVEAWIRRIEPEDRLVIRGWEVERISFPGGFAKDEGCNTLIVTWVCFADL